MAASEHRGTDDEQVGCCLIVTSNCTPVRVSTLTVSDMTSGRRTAAEMEGNGSEQHSTQRTAR